MILSCERWIQNQKEKVEENGTKNLFRRKPIDEAEKFIKEYRIAESLFRRRKQGHKRPEAEFRADKDKILSG